MPDGTAPAGHVPPSFWCRPVPSCAVFVRHASAMRALPEHSQSSFLDSAWHTVEIVAVAVPSRGEAREGESMSRVVLAVALLALGCGGSSGPQTVFNASMNGASETPANTSTATGQAQFTLSTVGGADGGVSTMSWTASSTPLAGTLSGFHIHLDTTPGSPGPVVVTLTSGLTQAADRSTDGGASFTAPDATAKNADGGVMTFDDLVAAMRTGQTYVNMHDRPTYTNGEIRGQLK